MEEYLNYDEYRLIEILDLISSMFPVHEHDDVSTIEPIHKSLIDWLTLSGNRHSHYYVSQKAGYNRLYEYIEGKYQAREYGNTYVMKYFAYTLSALKKYDRIAEILDDYALQKTIIVKLDFDSGLERYIAELENLYKNNQELCLQLFSKDTFINIFSENRRLLYNSGLFINLKNVGLSVALRTDTHHWGIEGEVGKAFYYYIAEEFEKAIKKVKTLLASEEIATDYVLRAELYNIKGLSERKLVLFSDALESFDNCIASVENVEEESRINSDVEFELSLAHLIKGKIYLNMLDFANSNKNCKKA